jgi:hypothetical protein
MTQDAQFVHSHYLAKYRPVRHVPSQALGKVQGTVGTPRYCLIEPAGRLTPGIAECIPPNRDRLVRLSAPYRRSVLAVRVTADTPCGLLCHEKRAEKLEPVGGWQKDLSA